MVSGKVSDKFKALMLWQLIEDASTWVEVAQRHFFDHSLDAE